MGRIAIITITYVAGLFVAASPVFCKSGGENEISPEEDLGFDDPNFVPETADTKREAAEQKAAAVKARPTATVKPPKEVEEPPKPAMRQSILQPATEDPAMDSDTEVPPLVNTAPPPVPQMQVQPEVTPVPEPQPAPIVLSPPVIPVAPAAPAVLTDPGIPSAAPAPPVAQGSPASQAASPDLEIIARKIGEPNEFSGAPLIPGSIRNVAGGEAPEEYIVESGDTLFDVCSQLLDEGGYWPRLWSVNPQIKNPHFIWPGMRLAFYQGGAESPPFLQVVAEEDLIPIDKGNLVEEQLVHGEIPDMDRAFEVPKVDVIDAKDLPDGDVSSQIAVVGALFDPSSRKVTLPGFIYASQKEPSGIVIGGVESEAMIGEGRQALAASESPLSVGTIYTVLRPENQIRNIKSGDDVGYLYSFIANVKVLSNIPDKEMSMIEVVQSRLGIERNDILVPFISTSRSLPIGNETGTISQSEGNVVAFEHEGQTVGGEGTMLFIDKGSQGGMSTGQFYKVFSHPGFLAVGEIKDALEGVLLPVAVIKVIDVTDAGAVGFIVKHTKEIHVGDSLSRG
jgi:hypothetical protein